MRTNCRAVKEAIRNHILEYYTIEELKNQIEAIRCRQYPTIYHAVKHMAESGCFLIYHGEVKDFLNGLGINPDNKEYTTEESWNLYCHLIARDSQLLMKNTFKL